jgi:hypothetical protein
MRVARVRTPAPSIRWFLLGFFVLTAATVVPLFNSCGTGEMTVAQAKALLANPGADANQRHIAAAALGRNALEATKLLCCISQEMGLAGIEARFALQRLQQELAK